MWDSLKPCDIVLAIIVGDRVVDFDQNKISLELEDEYSTRSTWFTNMIAFIGYV